ncbi:2,3-bisphosphoglycerate-independent phosphoglycerate mutase [Patescibacteria group bacterium]|nr:2,3-bisphosphoglycerate-independent phosphoglycerate mutase [Patescibacteria group bacterium]
MKIKPVVLIIRDGWGYRADKKNNTIAMGKTPNTDKLMKNYPHILLSATGEAVGLPKGYQGNSEVGHMTIGTGRIIPQFLVRINQSIEDKTFFHNLAFLGAIQNCKKHKTKLHLIGLLQTEGVHSHIDHLFALLDLCKKEQFYNVYTHIITDGRDAPVTASIEKIKKLQKKIRKLGFGIIATVSGRYYAMDRDKNWDRTQRVYDCIIRARAGEYSDIVKQIQECHKKEETDEFIVPRKLVGYSGVDKNDSIIFYNFRTDRPRQLTQAIIEKKFEGWTRIRPDVYFVAMTEFYDSIKTPIAFVDIPLKNLLGETISRHGLKQLRISETEKYMHITFFFNGCKDAPYKNEKRILIPSPRVATYDLKPEMSIFEITNKLLQKIDEEKYNFIVVNLVNGDMIGHTGVLEAGLRAVEVVDECVGKITSKVLEKDGYALVSADHGNIEDQGPKWNTSHTLNKVSFILVSQKGKELKLHKKGGLQDIAPTVLDLLNIKKPHEMSGDSLIKKNK